MVGTGLGLQQFAASDQPLSRLFPHFGLFTIGQTRGHGTGRDKERRQMAKMQGADEEPGNDLVAHAEQQRRIKNVVAEGDGRRHGNHIARKQAEFHTGGALRHAIAHGRHTACDLRRGAEFSRLDLDDVWVMLERRVGRQHVVVGAHDSDVGRSLRHHPQFVIGR